MHTLGIIPARYGSTRFPGKPLAIINGKPMIQHVYEKTCQALDFVVAATDDERIINAVEAFGGNVVSTNKNHQSGTDRCAEALLKYEKDTGKQFNAIINIQGDEPFIDPEQILQVNHLLQIENADLATLIKPIDSTEHLFNPNKVKVIIDKSADAIYFSRQPIPYLRGEDTNHWIKKHTYYHHIGMYGYSRQALINITKLKKSNLEICESLEQLRWIENGYKIKTAITQIESIGIDTPDDLENIL